MKNKIIFKVGDKVFDHQYGWGKVVDAFENDLVLVEFDGVECEVPYRHNGAFYGNMNNPTLSFTEYTLDGFSQERPIDYSEYVGKWGVFWDDEDDEYRLIFKFKCFEGGVFQSEGGIWYDNFKPLIDEQIKALEL